MIEGAGRVERAVNGNIYLGGRTNSTLDIASEDAHQTTFNGVYDAFVFAFDSNYTLLWSTYLGGDEVESLFGMTTDSESSVVITGLTNSSSNVSTIGSFQEEFSGYNDIFLSKFSYEGELLWSTYYGSGVGGEYANSVDVDSYDNIYIAGLMSSDSLGTPGVFQEYSGGFVDGFISKFSPNGELIWTSYFGGEEGDEIFDIEVNSFGEICILGQTDSDSLSSEGAYQAELAGSNDSFIALFDSTGNRIWATYYGGTSFDGPKRISVDADDNIIICGRTSSSSGIATTGAHKETTGFADLFLASFDHDGWINWGTYFGGDDFEGSYSEVKAVGTDIIFAGETLSETEIATENAFQLELDNSGSEDGFITKFNISGVQQWGSYYGSQGFDAILGLDIIDDSKILLGMATSSTNGLSTEDAFQSDNNGAVDAMLAVFEIDIVLDINEHSRYNANIYPNPASKNVTVSIKNQVSIEGELEILTVDGKRVVRIDNYTTNTELSINFTPGLYVMKLLIDDDLYVSKLVVE